MTAIEQLTLRPYHRTDDQALYDIDLEFQHEEGFGMGDPDRPLFPHLDMDDIDGVYTNAGGAFWVLEGPGGELAGYGAVLRVDHETARLRRFRIATAWRRRGLATRLLEEAERFCSERGYRHVTLGTNEKNRAAQALYAKHGYAKTGSHVFPNGERELEFAKELW